MNHPHITVIVCTRDRPALLEQCLGALSAQTYRNFEVLVVDNASAQPVREICERWNARYVFEPIPGVAKASNTGVREARGEVVAFIDDDAVADADWLCVLAAEFANPGIGAVTGHIRYMKAVRDSRTMRPQLASDQSAARPRASFDSSTPGWFRLACFGGIGDGSNMAFRRDVFSRGLAFEERLGRGRLLDGGFEHVAFMQIIRAGHRIMHSPELVVRHPFPDDAPLRHARQSVDLRNSIAYVMFLLAEFPAYRWQVAGFLLRALARRLTGYKYSRRGRIPLSLAFAAMARGPFLYWRARRDWSSGKKTASSPARRAEPAYAPRFQDKSTLE
jgi:glycosyltransferase involved in cell wall biosynthesis